MKAEHINPFLAATVNVFNTMLNCPLTRGQPFAKNGVQPQFDVSGVIGLSGTARGTVVLSLSRETALRAAEAVLGERPDAINADVRDAVGELTNIIAGNAKAKLESYALNVSLPTVITGKGHCIDFPREVIPICIPFDSPWGPVIVEVGLQETGNGSADGGGRA
jgi:chemotaxis protein CheX